MIVYKQIGDKRIAYLSPHMGLRRASDMKPRMDSELQGILDRADELTEEFRKEFERCIENMSVTERAKNLFHEVLIKTRAAAITAIIVCLTIIQLLSFRKTPPNQKQPTQADQDNCHRLRNLMDNNQIRDTHYSKRARRYLQETNRYITHSHRAV